MKQLPHLASISLIVLTATHASHAGHVEKYFGEAKKDDRLAYTESHFVKYDDSGQIVEAETTYRDPKGETISVLKSDFRASLTAPDHIIKNLRTGNVQGIRTGLGKIILFNQDAGKPEQTKSLPTNDENKRVAFGCQGLNYYLLKNLSDFRQKKVVPIRFLIPGNLEAYDFEIHYIREAGDIAEVEIEIDNWFLRLFAPKLKVKYDTKKKRIAWYEGLSNLKDDAGKNQNVTITYRYEQ